MTDNRPKSQGSNIFIRWTLPYEHLGNTAKFFWPIGDRMNGVALY